MNISYKEKDNNAIIYRPREVKCQGRFKGERTDPPGRNRKYHVGELGVGGNCDRRSQLGREDQRARVQGETTKIGGHLEGMVLKLIVVEISGNL